MERLFHFPSRFQIEPYMAFQFQPTVLSQSFSRPVFSVTKDPWTQSGVTDRPINNVLDALSVLKTPVNNFSFADSSVIDIFLYFINFFQSSNFGMTLNYSTWYCFCKWCHFCFLNTFPIRRVFKMLSPNQKPRMSGPKSLEAMHRLPGHIIGTKQDENPPSRLILFLPQSTQAVSTMFFTENYFTQIRASDWSLSDSSTVKSWKISPWFIFILICINC